MENINKTASEVNTSEHAENSVAQNVQPRKLRRLFKDSRGASFVEYLVLVAVIALAGMTAMGKITSGISKAADGQRGTIEQLGGK